jgi:hypothetical protein
MDTESFQPIHAINRPHAPDEATADFIFKAYMLLKNAPPTFTVIITKEQNNAGGDHTTWGKIIAVPEGMFTTSGYGFNVRKRTEIPWVAAKVAELDQE